MLKIVKILNNNAVIVRDEGEEKIAIGSGVGFNKKKQDLVPPEKIEKLFVLKENSKLHDLLLRIPEEHFVLAESILAYAEQHLDTKLNEHVLLALSDHLSFAIEREQQGLRVQNKLLPEIKILYKKEFEVGLWALEQIKNRLHLDMPVDEAGFIALHIHTMKMKAYDLQETIRYTAMVKEMVDIVRRHLNVSLEEDEISYERLLYHLRFALNRAAKEAPHSMDEEMLAMIKRKFQRSFACAEEMGAWLASKYGLHLPEEELGYIALHIERLRDR